MTIGWGSSRTLKERLRRQRVKAREERGRAERARAKAEAEARHPKQLAMGL